MAQVPAPRPPGRIRAYFQHSAEPSQAAALTLPLLCLYGLGVLLVPAVRNGVDFVSVVLYSAFQSLGSLRAFGYLTFYGLLIGANIGLISYLSKKKKFHVRYFAPLIGESTVYAVATGNLSAAITANLTDIFHAVPALAVNREFGLIDGIFVSAGAGLHEELVFRLVGIAGVGRVLFGAGWQRPGVRLLLLVLASSVLFSAVHHIVEPFVFTTFLFRVVAGLLFAALFLLRGFAVAAWTHFLYDVWVIVLLGA